MASPQTTFLLILLSSAFLYLVIMLYTRKQKASTPPGPKQLPFIGNMLGLPTAYPWIIYADMAQKHDGAVYLEVLGQPLLLLSSSRWAYDLLDKRSSNYSDRAWSTMLHELVGLTWSTAFLPYGDAWRRRRRVFQAYFHHKNLGRNCHGSQQQAAHALLRDLAENYTSFSEHIRKFTATIILKTAYGHDVKTNEDPFFLIGELELKNFEEIAANGTYLVDVMPFLKHVPSWFPGAGFKKIAAETKALAARMITEPFEKARLSRKACFVTHYLSQLEHGTDLPFDEEVIRDAAGIAYGAGVDTTSAAITTFVLAMVLHPEIQKKAQAELDSVLSGERLPTFDDKPDLPYIQCIVQEVLRWKPVVPLNIPHRCADEDHYNGYRIPPGTHVIGNLWAMLHDATKYPDPETFNPDRFLHQAGKEIQPNPSTLAFGFGRRICAARHLAQDTIWIAIASILSVFSIVNDVDEGGKEIIPDVSFTSSLISQPKPFKCRFILHSKDAERLISRE